jgi:uncharacterized membrane protein
MGVIKKVLFNHPRLLLSAAAASILVIFLPHAWSIWSRVLICWNFGVVLFLVLLLVWMSGLTAEQICSRYRQEDESAPFILIAVILAAMLSLVAILDPLASLKSVSGPERVGHFALAALTLVNSWLLVPTMFTAHYADRFYSSDEAQRPLRFPDTSMPAFWDFAYFSFTIAAACQTADVSTLSADIRRLVLGHTLISFLFNASILGFAINVTAGLI